LEDNFEKLREFEARKQAVLVQTTPEERQSEVHRKKTFKNMENFLALYFANGLLNHNAGQLADIDIFQVVPNKCNTVMNIFWNISSEYLLKEGIAPGSNHYE
jgi:ketol-acid reductoisomerase